MVHELENLGEIVHRCQNKRHKTLELERKQLG